MKTKCRFVLAMLGVTLALAMTVALGNAFAQARMSVGGGGSGNPRVLPPASHPYGHTYGEWGALWWQWAFSFPAADVPFFQASGPADCGAHQSGGVWFLAGSNVGTVTRSCSVPEGTALFFPLANLVDDWPCPDPNFGPAPGQTLEEFLTNDANQYLQYMTGLFATIDGVNLRNLGNYQATSRLFTFTADPALASTFDPCIQGVPQSGVATGYWLLLPPLSRGQHTLHFGSSGWGQDVTYNLSVGHDASAGMEPLPASGGISPATANSTWGHVKSIYR
jgi:hypothetical protein